MPTSSATPITRRGMLGSAGSTNTEGVPPCVNVDKIFLRRIFHVWQRVGWAQKGPLIVVFSKHCPLTLELEEPPTLRPRRQNSRHRCRMIVRRLLEGPGCHASPTRAAQTAPRLSQNWHFISTLGPDPSIGDRLPLPTRELQQGMRGTMLQRIPQFLGTSIHQTNSGFVWDRVLIVVSLQPPWNFANNAPAPRSTDPLDWSGMAPSCRSVSNNTLLSASAAKSRALSSFALDNASSARRIFSSWRDCVSWHAR